MVVLGGGAVSYERGTPVHFPAAERRIVASAGYDRMMQLWKVGSCEYLGAKGTYGCESHEEMNVDEGA